MTAKRVMFKDMKLDEQTWRKAERNQANRERRRLIETGLIVPFYRLGPSMLTKSDTSKTGWKASA